jgi:hypothetical protein
MPYELQALYQTVPSNPDRCWGTSVTLVDPETDDAGIVFRCAGDDAPDESFHIDVDEWPLIVRAVDMLLANKQPKKEAFKPAAPKEFLEAISFNSFEAIQVLNGRIDRLIHCFCWSETEQGNGYWADRKTNRVPLSDDDKALIESWVDAAEYHEKNDD